VDHEQLSVFLNIVIEANLVAVLAPEAHERRGF